MLSKITVSPAPHISANLSTRRVMGDVLIGLLPAVIAAGVFFRLRALLVIAVCVIACLVSEWLCNRIRKRPTSIGDLSAAVTGVILGMSLPPMVPYSVAIVGSAFAIVIAKMVFGGLGSNVFNPAMAARAFMVASFGAAMMTWTVPAMVDAESREMTAANTSATTQATPLAWSKNTVRANSRANSILSDKTRAERAIERLTKEREQLLQKELAPPANVEKTLEYASIQARIEAAKEIIARSEQAYPSAVAETKELLLTTNKQTPWAFWGRVGGCLGETSGLAFLLGGAYLLFRRTITWHIPAAVLLSAGGIALAAWLINPEGFVNPLLHLCGGGLLMCAFFIATDPVTAPLTTRGMWIFGAGVGALIMLIRIVGEYPEGVMYAVLIMNAFTPLIDRCCKLKPAGGVPNVG